MEPAPGFADAPLRGRAGVCNDPAPAETGGRSGGEPWKKLGHLLRYRRRGEEKQNTPPPSPFRSTVGIYHSR